MSPKRTQTPGQIVKSARDARGWSQEELARRVGISQPAIKKIEDGVSKKSRFMPKIAEVLNLEIAEVDHSLSPSVNHPTEKPGSGNPDMMSRVPLRALIGQRDLPVHGSAQGGRGALIVTTEAVEWLGRPQPLEGVKDGYGIIVSESSMEPEFEPGDIALVHPHKPPKPGETCIFYARHQDGTVEAVIKRLRRETPDAWHVRQFNPPRGQRRDYVLKKSEWQQAHVTVGRFRR